MNERNVRREAELEALLDTIQDPCSLALGRPLGLGALGIVDRVEVSGGCVTVEIMPTMPGCLFIGVIEEKIERLVEKMAWCERLEVKIVDGLWDPSRIVVQDPGADLTPRAT